jgi:hypothetical protein
MAAPEAGQFPDQRRPDHRPFLGLLGRELINLPAKPDARVCFGPKSDKSLHCSEMSKKGANTRHRRLFDCKSVGKRSDRASGAYRHMDTANDRSAVGSYPVGSRAAQRENWGLARVSFALRAAHTIRPLGLLFRRYSIVSPEARSRSFSGGGPQKAAIAWRTVARQVRRVFLTRVQAAAVLS